MLNRDSRRVLMEGEERNGLYQLPIKSEGRRSLKALSDERVSSQMRHCCLGHLHRRVISALVNKNVLCSNCKKLEDCDSCLIGKLTHSPH